MSSSLSSLVDNLSEGLHSEKCADCKSHLDYMLLKDDKPILRCFEYKKNYEKEFNKELIKRFANMYEFCNKDINKFVLLSKKGIYPYCLIKKAFYSNLNVEDITDIEYSRISRSVCAK